MKLWLYIYGYDYSPTNRVREVKVYTNKEDAVNRLCKDLLDPDRVTSDISYDTGLTEAEITDQQIEDYILTNKEQLIREWQERNEGESHSTNIHIVEIDTDLPGGSDALKIEWLGGIVEDEWR